MRTHAADVASAVLQNVHRCRRARGYLIRGRLLKHRVAADVTVAVRAVGHSLIVRPQIHNLRKQAMVLRAHRKLLLVSESILVLEDQRVVGLLRVLRICRYEHSRA